MFADQWQRGLTQVVWQMGPVIISLDSFDSLSEQSKLIILVMLSAEANLESNIIQISDFVVRGQSSGEDISTPIPPGEDS